MSGGSRCAVVIPAHDEETVLGRLLASLRPLASEGFDVIVVPNGCTDRTEEIADGAGWVRTVAVEAASKPAALNAGIEAAGAGPCIFLDADIRVEPQALRALAAVVATPEPIAASLRVRFDLAGRPWAVRAFYSVFADLPYATDGLVGLGIYALSAAGMARLGRFPPVTADDLHVQRLFSSHERVVVEEHAFTVAVPRSLAALVKVRTRIAAGNTELAGLSAVDGVGAPSTASTLGALARLLARRPARLLEILDYVLVTVVARLRARRRTTAWERDLTTR